jgi:2-polyprenyl-6-methoxyphenol hydroxylase-like FAD-dependent oxidoreductase
MAGLLAGRVLADHFDRVTVVERDRFPEAPGPRKGAPQARHAHVMLARGRQVMEDLFPGLNDELAAAGAPFLDAGDDIACHSASGWAVRYRAGIGLLSASRDLLEWSARRRLAALPRIAFVEGTDVLGLLPGAGRVAGVELRARQSAEAPRRLEADLVVDATGRGSRAPQWLEALGYSAPEETVINSFVGYASRLYRPPAGRQPDWRGLYFQATGAATRGGLVLPIEGGRWIVTLTGRGGDHPPTDEAGFLAFARSLPGPELHDAIADAEPLGPITGHRATENRVRHFERLRRWPDGLVVLGDAACAFNPVYGQGMTAAALGALTLGEWLAGGAPARRFQAKLARANASPWLLATGEDARFPGTVGARRGWLTRLLDWYTGRVLRRSVSSPAVRTTLLEVIHLLRGPSALFSPRVVWELLRGRPAR